MLSDEDFFRSVQNPATRTKDHGELVRQGLAHLRSGNVFVRAGAACVLCYRLIEDDAHPNLEQEVVLQALLNVQADLDRHRETQGSWMRWTISVDMALGYTFLLMERYPEATACFSAVARRLDQLHLWPQMTASHIGARLFLGLLKARAGDTAGAIAALEEAGNVLRTGLGLLPLNRYWVSYELIGAMNYLCECSNEAEFLRTGTPPQARGKHLWGHTKLLFARHFTPVMA